MGDLGARGQKMLVIAAHVAQLPREIEMAQEDGDEHGQEGEAGGGHGGGAQVVAGNVVVDRGGTGSHGQRQRRDAQRADPIETPGNVHFFKKLLGDGDHREERDKNADPAITEHKRQDGDAPDGGDLLMSFELCS